MGLYRWDLFISQQKSQIRNDVSMMGLKRRKKFCPSRDYFCKRASEVLPQGLTSWCALRWFPVSYWWVIAQCCGCKKKRNLRSIKCKWSSKLFIQQLVLSNLVYLYSICEVIGTKMDSWLTIQNMQTSFYAQWAKPLVSSGVNYWCWEQA